MKVFNERGQEFSVFKLLISAVVAVVILTLLLQIIGIIPGLGQSNPTAESVSILKDAYNNRYNDFRSKEVTFKDNEKVNRKAVSEKTELIEEQDLCLFLDPVYEGGSWQITDDYIQYTGGGQKLVFLAAYCDIGEDLEGNISEQKYSSFIPGEVDIMDCDCKGQRRTCCVLGVVAG